MAHLLYIRTSFHQHMKERKRQGQADSLSSLSLSLRACVFMPVPMCVYLCSYGSSEMILDETLLPRNVTQILFCVCICSNV